MSGNRCVMIPEYGEVPVFEPFRFEKKDWHDGIVVRSPNWLGDAVMSLPALLQLKSLLPGGQFSAVKREPRINSGKIRKIISAAVHHNLLYIP